MSCILYLNIIITMQYMNHTFLELGSLLVIFTVPANINIKLAPSMFSLIEFSIERWRDWSESEKNLTYRIQKQFPIML